MIYNDSLVVNGITCDGDTLNVNSDDGYIYLGTTSIKNIHITGNSTLNYRRF